MDREKILREAYLDGMRDGAVRALQYNAWWKDGVQYIGQQKPDGTGVHTLKDAVALILELLPTK